MRTIGGEKLGDQGQRYEVRMTGYPKDGENVLGWTDELSLAEKMLTAILKAPGCTSATIFDRHESKPKRFGAVSR